MNPQATRRGINNFDVIGESSDWFEVVQRAVSVGESYDWFQVVQRAVRGKKAIIGLKSCSVLSVVRTFEFRKHDAYIL